MHDDPIAFFITWTCYGTWMPGDERGWTKWHKGDRMRQPLLAEWCRNRLAEPPVVLDATQRQVVANVIREHCGRRVWKLHGINCRTNHCHVVVTAPNYDGEQVRDQLKSWSTRRLKEQLRSDGVHEKDVRKRWSTSKDSVRYLFDEESLNAAVVYCLHAQEIGGSNADR